MVNQFEIWQQNREAQPAAAATAPTTSLVKPKTQKQRKTISSLLENFIPKPATAGSVGPQTLDTKRDAWANALSTMNNVYTPTPMTALAKVAGMGLAGYNVGKATSEKESGQTAFRAKLAQALKGGVPDNATISELMTDPYSEGANEVLFGLWDRNNPAPNTKPNMATIEYPNGTKIPVDLNTEEGQKLYSDFVTKMQSSSTGGMPGGGVIKDPMKITDNMQQSKVQQAAPTIAATLGSMQKSLTDPSAISDLDFVYGVAKIMDPTSVVRTEEGRAVIESQSLSGQFVGMLNKLANGESALTPETRLAMYRLAERRGGETLMQAKTEREFYAKMAEQNGYDPETYVPAVPGGPMGPIPSAEIIQARRSGASAVPQPSGAPAAPSGNPPATPVPPQPPTFDPTSVPFDNRLRTVPGAQQLWPRIAAQADTPEELDTIVQAITRDPTMLQTVFPDAFMPGGER